LTLEFIVIIVILLKVHLGEGGKFIKLRDHSVAIDTVRVISFQAKFLFGNEQDIRFPFRMKAVGMVLSPIRY